jgi:hypothetical protein
MAFSLCGQPGVVEQPTEAPASKEAEVGPVENAALVVVEEACSRAASWVPVPEVRHARDDCSARSHRARQLGDERFGSSDVFDDIGGDDNIEIGANSCGQAVLEVGDVEHIGALTDPVRFGDVDSGDVMPLLAEYRSHVARAASDIEDA